MSLLQLKNYTEYSSERSILGLWRNEEKGIGKYVDWNKTKHWLNKTKIIPYRVKNNIKLTYVIIVGYIR